MLPPQENAEYYQMGYEAGTKRTRTLSLEDKKYIKAVDKPGCTKYREGNPREGVSVVIDSFREKGGQTYKRVIQKLVKQTDQTWTGNELKAQKYIDRIMNDFKRGALYGYLLYQIGDRHFVRRATPVELCYEKFGDKKILDELSPDQRDHYLVGWFDGLRGNSRKIPDKNTEDEPNKSAQAEEILPTREDFESAYKTCTPVRGEISIEEILDQIEVNAKDAGRRLNSDWRIITEKNILNVWTKTKKD